MGNNGGIPKSSDRIIGKLIPTPKPYFQPHRNPLSKTGICIGSIIIPIWGICPVKKGSIIPTAMKIAESVKFLVVEFTIPLSLAF